MEGGGLQPLAGGRTQACDGVVDVLHDFAKRADDRLVGAEFGDLAKLGERDLLGFLHFLGALVQRLRVAGCQQRRPLTGKACALRGKLQAGGQSGNVPSAQIEHRSAEMPQHQAGAGADHDGHARDDRECGKKAAPDTPARTEEPQIPTKITDCETHRHAGPARNIRQVKMSVGSIMLPG